MWVQKESGIVVPATIATRIFTLVCDVGSSSKDDSKMFFHLLMKAEIL
jgi:hypothetical protein